MSIETDLATLLISTLPHAIAGAVVGIMVGLTGVGGGSLMTPILIGFGYNPATAIGTDLFYAAFTKAGGVYYHHKENHIRWDIVRAMAAGSLPAAIITATSLKFFFADSTQYTHLLTTSLGVMLILTACALLFKKHLTLSIFFPKLGGFTQEKPLLWTLIMGIPLGSLVTLSSVGAGALGTALLLALYPSLSGSKVVGTDIAHAVPLTLVAGISHFLLLDTVDWQLLLGLLVGSLPGIAIGTRLNKKIPNEILLTALALCLFVIGIKYAFF